MYGFVPLDDTGEIDFDLFSKMFSSIKESKLKFDAEHECLLYILL